MSDTNCPYCNAEIKINHDDGQGYEEGRFHEQECQDCGKVFTFTTSISFYYEAQKADCLNGGEHKFKSTMTTPRRYTKMECVDCDERREPTEEEWRVILKDE